MAYEFDIRTTDMPAEMQSLLRVHPRDTWDDHPGFQDKTRQWLNAHQTFRRINKVVRTDTEKFLDRAQDGNQFADRLGYYGSALVGNLHGHHAWEDFEYFPELSAADPRFDAGLEILESDHVHLNAVLDDFTRVANRVIKLQHLDEPAAYEEAGELDQVNRAIEAFLDRHLGDEEDLAVPIILQHRLRG